MLLSRDCTFSFFFFHSDFETSTDHPKFKSKSVYVIRNLDVSFNQICDLSHLTANGGDLMEKFAALVHLDISHNLLQSIPEDIVVVSRDIFNEKN